VVVSRVDCRRFSRYRFFMMQRLANRLFFRLSSIRDRLSMLSCGRLLLRVARWLRRHVGSDIGDRRSDLGRQGHGVLCFDFANCGFKLFKLPLQHGFRRTRLHILELPLNSTASALVNLHPHLGSVVGQAVNRPPDNCDKIRH
jgi:hypothetical protein